MLLRPPLLRPPLLLLLLVLTGCPPAPAPPAAALPPAAPASEWAGTYRSEAMTLHLEPAAGVLGGTIEFRGQRYPLQAQPGGAGLSGSFTSDGASFELTAVRQDDALRLTTGGATYVLRRHAPANPLAQAATPPAGEAAGPESAEAKSEAAASGEAPRREPASDRPPLAGDDWLSFTHSVGLTFRHPADWTAQETEQGLALTPPDPSRNAQGPTEAYLINALPAPGVTRPDAPQAVQHLEELMASLFPFLRREGGVEAVPGEEPGALLTWAGANPAGLKVRARLFATIREGTAFLLLAVGDAAQLPRREPAVRAIFHSFRYERPPVDAALTGTWLHSETYISGSFSSITRRYLTLSPDGTCTSSSRLMAGMEHTDGAGHSTGSSSADSGGSADHGRWRSAGQQLFLEWADGSSESYRYYRENADLLLTPLGGGKKKLFKRVR